MKDIMKKLAELEATAPKATTKKKMITEDSVSRPEQKKPSLKDMFNQLSETVAPGQKPLPVMDPTNKQAGMGFVTSNNPAVQNMLKNLDPKDVQIVQAPGHQPQASQTAQPGQPNQAGATGQPQQGQQQMKEKDEGKPGKNFAKIAKSAAKRYGSKEAGERVAGAVRAKLAKQGKLEEEQLDELSRRTLGSYGDKVGDLNARMPAGHNYTKALKHQKGARLAYDKSYGAAGTVPATGVDKVNAEVQEEQLDEKFASQQQAKLMYATAGGADTGVSKKVAKEFIKKSHGQKVSKLPKKVKEGDIPSTQGIDTMGAGLGAGRSMTTLEGAKPDFLDLDKDGNKKESMKKAAADKKKKKVDESMNHRISAARLEGKSHGLRGHAHSGKRYDDLEEMKAYHEGYKEGLDECYGQGVYETAPAMPAATVPGMASQAMPTMEDDMEEGNAFTAALAKTPKGGKFSVGGKTFTDNSSLEEYAFEAWDRELSNLLNEGTDVNEGLSVSVSKGQQNSPDSVTITAQDQEADQLLQLVKHAGLGLFGDDHAEPSSAMSVQPAHGAADEVGAGGVDIDVIDGHDGMMGLMQKLSGIQAGGDEDYADEEGDEEQLYGNQEEGHGDCGCEGDCECNKEKANEETCNECGGMMEAGHSCGSKEMVDEVESEDQMEFEVAEDNAPDTETAEHNADEEAEAQEDSALAQAAQQNKTNTVNEGGDGGEASEEGAESKEGETDEEGETVSESFTSLLARLTNLAEGSGDEPKHSEHDKKDDKDHDDDEEEEDSEDVTEGLNEWANQVGKGPGKGTDASFEQDIEFMTKVIAGGLNKPKSTGQTTIPVIAGQEDRMHDSPKDWATLAGIKKA